MPNEDELKAIRAHVLEAREAAARLGGVVSRASAAAAWNWEALRVPVLPEITVPKGRRLLESDRRGASIRRATLAPDDIVDGLTSRRRTLLDCARSLSFEEALTITDSALRHGYSGAALQEAAASAKGPGSIKVRQVAHHASGKAANVFESRLRAICLRVAGLNVRPQVPIGNSTDFLGTPDLVDVDLRLVIEADSFEWHGQRPALIADARRYNGFITNGWLVVRFTWVDVMLNPAVVEEVLTELVSAARTNRDGWAA
jgi:very-short-patch-repair endonuclease